MKSSNKKASQSPSRPAGSRPGPREGAPATMSLPAVVATVFVRLRLRQRVRVLRRLLLPIGPMALVVLAGGRFAKYAGSARSPRMRLSLEDAARVSASQIYELGRYVEQSDPAVLRRVIALIARDTATMAALGGSLAARLIEQLAPRGILAAPA